MAKRLLELMSVLFCLEVKELPSHDTLACQLKQGGEGDDSGSFVDLLCLSAP